MLIFMFEEYRKRRTIKKILNESPYLNILKDDILILNEETKHHNNLITEVKSESIFFGLSTLESLVDNALRMSTSEIRINADYYFIHELSDGNGYKKIIEDISKRVGLSLILDLDSKKSKFSYRIVN